MSDIILVMDGREIRAPKGQRLLWCALDNGIDIPHLCAIREQYPPFGACRLCFVEIEGWNRPVTSCTVPAVDGMKVTTRSPAVERLVHSGFEFLISAHDVQCKDCQAKSYCGLIGIAKKFKLKLKTRRIPNLELGLAVDESHPRFILNPNRCILCGKCVWVCREKVGLGVIAFINRGLKTTVGTFDHQPLAEACPSECAACVKVCPVGALAFKAEHSGQEAAP